MARIHVEQWPATMSGPYLLTEDDAEAGECEIVEDGGQLRAHTLVDGHDDSVRVAFVDGVRRGEARLYLEDANRLLHGVAGAHGHGAVLCEPSALPVFAHCEVQRIAVWGGGGAAMLPEQPGGWAWEVRAVTEEHPDAPLQAFSVSCVRLRAVWQSGWSTTDG